MIYRIFARGQCCKVARMQGNRMKPFCELAWFRFLSRRRRVWTLAPRFSVGKEAGMSPQPRRGVANGEIVIKISFMRLTWS